MITSFIPFPAGPMSKSAAIIPEFLNSTFGNIDALSNVDGIISHLQESLRSDTNKDGCETDPGVSDAPTNCIVKMHQMDNVLSNSPEKKHLDNVALDLENIKTELKTNNEFKIHHLLCEKVDLLRSMSISSEFTEILTRIENLHISDNTHLLDELSQLQGMIQSFNNESQSKLVTKFTNLIAERILPEFQQRLLNDIDAVEKFENLLRLQKYSIFQSIDEILAGSKFTIWAIDCLCRDFSNKFIYHFESENETNRLDKPEFAIDYTINYLRKNILNFKSKYARTFHSVLPLQGSFGTWFINSILATLKSKFRNEIMIMIENDNTYLLSHLINELKRFDSTILNEFNFIVSRNPNIKFNGLTYDLVLVDDKILTIWIKNEKNFVNNRFNELIEKEDSFAIDFDYIEKGKTKPTKSAINLKNLVEGITINYNSLPLKFQYKFLSEIQLKLLNFYFDTLHTGFKSLKSLKIDNKDDNIIYLERICRIWCSSKFIIEMMDKWSNEIIFIELWNSLNGDSNFESTFFESVIRVYKKEILSKIPNLLTKYFEFQFNKTLKYYFQENSNWSAKNYDDYQLNDLSPLIKLINSDLSYLENMVAHSTFIEWKLLISDKLTSYFENNLVLSNSFSPSGADKLRTHILHVFDETNLIKNYKTFQRLLSMLDVLQTGESASAADGRFNLIDDSEVEMLLLKRR